MMNIDLLKAHGLPPTVQLGTRNVRFRKSHHCPISTHASQNTASTTPQIDPLQIYPIIASFVTPGSLLEAGNTSYGGRGLVIPDTAAQIDPGTVLLSVDWANLLAVTEDPVNDGDQFSSQVLEDWQSLHGPLPAPLLQLLSRHDVKWFCKLSAWLLWLRANGTGIWQIYSQLLPTESEMTCLMNYSEHEALSELQHQALLNVYTSEQTQLRQLYDAVFSPRSGLPELQQLNLAPQFQDMVWALSMINSRVFGETIKNEKVALMVPCADYANHSYYAPDAQFQFNSDKLVFELTALRTLVPGQEVCISYGCIHKNTAEMMKDYGFFVPGNLNDRISFADEEIDGKSPVKPSLDAERLLGAWNLDGGVPLGKRSFELIGDSSPDVLMSLDTEDGIAKRRRVVTFMSLGEGGFLRNIPKKQRIELPPMGEEEREWEKKAAVELERRCRVQLAMFPTSIETDENLLFSSSIETKESGRREEEEEERSPRWKMAVMTRLELKRTLAAAAENIHIYRETLEG